MLSEDAYHFASRPLASPRKALAHLRESGVSGLKDATLDLGLEYIGLERVHAVCGLVTDRLARTREVLQRMSPGEGAVDQSLGILPISSVCTLGVSLLDRTEAIFDRWLTLTSGSADCVDGGENSESEDSVPRVPRPMPGGIVVRTLSWRVSRKAVVHFTLLGIQETCNSVLQCLGSSDIVKMLARRLRTTRREDRSSRHALVSRASRLAHQGCERILGDAATMRLLDLVGRLLGRWLGSVAGFASEDFRDEDPLQLEVLDPEGAAQLPSGGRLQADPAGQGAAAQAGSEAVAVEPLSGSRCETPGQRFNLVVKNSFIEVVEEPDSPVNIRRTQSLDGIAGKKGRMEVYTLVVNCLPAGRSQPSAPSTAQERRPKPPAPGPVSRPRATGRSKAAAPPPAPTLAPAAAVAAPATSSSPGQTGAEEEANALNTTVLLKGLPSTYTTLSMLELLYAHGFSGQFTFVYVPVDFARGSSLGYAVVCLASHESALGLMRAFNGFGQFAADDGSVCVVSWNEPHQGLDALVERYRNSPVMHHSVADAFRPAVFADGQRIPFPEPTRTVRAPRIRHVRASQQVGAQR